MIVIREPDLDYLETPGGNRTAGIATPSRGARDVSVIRQRQQPGGENPSHSHDREEVVLVTEGTIEVQMGAESVVLHEGDTLVIPEGAVHRLANVGASEAEWLLIAPAGVGFFHASGERAEPAWAQ